MTTLDSGNTNANITLSNGNLTATLSTADSNWHASRSTTSKSSGKWYFEVTVNTTNNSGGQTPINVGVCNSTFPVTTSGSGNYMGGDGSSNSMGYTSDGVAYRHAGSIGSASIYSAVMHTNSNVVGVALDMDNGILCFVDVTNNIWYEPLDITTGNGSGITGWPVALYAGISLSTLSNAAVTINFGGSAFSGTVPLDFAAWDAALPSAAATRFDNNSGGGPRSPLTSIIAVSGANNNIVTSAAIQTKWATIAANNFVSSGKLYCEYNRTAASGTYSNDAPWGVGLVWGSVGHGVSGEGNVTYPGHDLGEVGYFGQAGHVYGQGNQTLATLATYAVGDTIGQAVDFSNKKIWWQKNGGNWNNDVIGNQNPATNTGGVSLSSVIISGYTYAPCVGLNSTAATGLGSITCNFGATAFTYTPPSGFSKWPQAVPSLGVQYRVNLGLYMIIQ